MVLFSKENSSLESVGKRGKDVALRKSDRRNLMQRALQVFGISSSSSSSNVLSSGEGGQGEEQHNENYPESHKIIRQIFQHVFLHGTLTQRTLLDPTQHQASLSSHSSTGKSKNSADKKIFLYYRSPDEEEDVKDLKKWPYQKLTQPIWIEFYNAKNEGPQLPTVALLSVLSKNMPNSATLPITTVTVFPPVPKYLCRGAHLMKAGIARVDINKGSSSTCAAVVVQGNPQPFAVGFCTSEVLAAADNGGDGGYGPGTQGLGVHIDTVYGDDLWKQQLPSSKSLSKNRHTNSYDLGHYGNPGFLHGQIVMPIEAIPDQDKEHDAVEASEETFDGGKEGKAITAEKDAEEMEPPTLAKDEEGDDGKHEDKDGETTSAQEGEAQKSAEPEEEAEPTEAAATSSALSPDEVLHQAVCRALVELHSKRDLPMIMATFYSQHVLKVAATVEQRIELKQTRYKKFGPYIQEQVDRGLLQVLAKDGDPRALLTGYNPRHDDLRPYVEQRKSEQANIQSGNGGGPRKMVLVDLFCVPNHFVDLMKLDKAAVQAADASSAERKGTGLLTAKEVRALLEDYVAREELVDPQNQAHVMMNGPLTDALYKTKKSAAEPPPTFLTRKALVSSWQERMEPAFCLVQMPGNHVIKLGRGKPPLVTIEVVQRQSKKYITKIRGLQAYGVHPAELRHELATRLGCAVAVEELPTSGKCTSGVKQEVQLQGNWVDEVEAILTGNEALSDHGGVKDSLYQLPPNAMEVLLRKGVPARKKHGVASAGTAKKKK